MKRYFLEELPKQPKPSKTLEKNDRYNCICRKLRDKSFPVQLAFLVSVEPIFKKFLCFFQSEGPLIHLLHHTMCELLKSLMGRFLKTHVLGEKEGKHLLTIDYSKPDNQLSMSQMEVGEKTWSALSKLSDDQQKKSSSRNETVLCGHHKVSDWPSTIRQLAFERCLFPAPSS